MTSLEGVIRRVDTGAEPMTWDVHDIVQVWRCYIPPAYSSLNLCILHMVRINHLVSSITAYGVPYCIACSRRPCHSMGAGKAFFLEGSSGDLYMFVTSLAEDMGSLSVLVRITLALEYCQIHLHTRVPTRRSQLLLRCLDPITKRRI